MRKQRKRVISILLAALMVASCLTGFASSFTSTYVAHAEELGTVATVSLDATEHGSVYFMDSTDSSMQVDIGTNVTFVICAQTTLQPYSFLGK